MRPGSGNYETTVRSSAPGSGAVGAQLAETTVRIYYADVETISASLLGRRVTSTRYDSTYFEFHCGSADRDPLVFIRYQHLDRFVVEAVATCGRPGNRSPVAIPQVQVRPEPVASPGAIRPRRRRIGLALDSTGMTPGRADAWR